MIEAKRNRGRPRLPDGERSRSTSLWLTPERSAKLKALGGSRFVSAVIDQSEEPMKKAKSKTLDELTRGHKARAITPEEIQNYGPKVDSKSRLNTVGDVTVPGESGPDPVAPFVIVDDDPLGIDWSAQGDAQINDMTKAVHHIDGNPRNNDLSNLTIAPIAENRRLLYRKVPGTNVSRADAVAYARKNWPFGALGRPATAGFEWQQDSMRHVMSWETLQQEPTK
jgi:hypothetical protein